MLHSWSLQKNSINTWFWLALRVVWGMEGWFLILNETTLRHTWRCRVKGSSSTRDTADPKPKQTWPFACRSGSDIWQTSSIRHLKPTLLGKQLHPRLPPSEMSWNIPIKSRVLNRPEKSSHAELPLDYWDRHFWGGSPGIAKELGTSKPIILVSHCKRIGLNQPKVRLP